MGSTDVNREQIIAALSEYEPELKAAGVISLSLFGSSARNEADPADVDIAVRLDQSFFKRRF